MNLSAWEQFYVSMEGSKEESSEGLRRVMKGRNVEMRIKKGIRNSIIFSDVSHVSDT